MIHHLYAEDVPPTLGRIQPTSHGPQAAGSKAEDPRWRQYPGGGEGRGEGCGSTPRYRRGPHAAGLSRVEGRLTAAVITQTPLPLSCDSLSPVGTVP